MSDLSTDGKALAITSLKAIGTAVDAIFKSTETQVPAFTEDVLATAQHLIPSLFPAAIAPAVSTALGIGLATAGPLLTKLDGPLTALLAAGQARVDATLASLEAKL